MNLVIDDAVEVKQVTKTNPEESRRELGTDTVSIAKLQCRYLTRSLGQILLKGDNVSLIQTVQS